MSFRELRSFTEAMRLLGYPQLISMESFRSPNVELVADCLYWLIKRYEPAAEVEYNIEREADRVLFFKRICEVALAKGRIKLNIKKLYKADGHAVQEMLRLASVLKAAARATTEDEPDFAALHQMAAQRGIHDAKSVQQLCSDITGDGSNLFFAIEEEMQRRAERQRVLTRATEVAEFERHLNDFVAHAAQQVDELQQSIASLAADESNLEQKIENKKTQLERAKKRYRSLLTVRPAFIEEYDKHAAELQAQFVKYLEQYRNLEYLEHEVARYNAADDAALEEQETRLRVMRENLRREELKAFRAEANSRSQHNARRGAQAADAGAADEDDDEGAAVAMAAAAGGGDGVPAHDGRERDWRTAGGARVRNAVDEGSSVASSSSMASDDDDEDDDGVDGRGGVPVAVHGHKRHRDDAAGSGGPHNTPSRNRSSPSPGDARHAARHGNGNGADARVGGGGAGGRPPASMGSNGASSHGNNGYHAHAGADTASSSGDDDDDDDDLDTSTGTSDVSTPDDYSDTSTTDGSDL